MEGWRPGNRIAGLFELKIGQKLKILVEQQGQINFFSRKTRRKWRGHICHTYFQLATSYCRGGGGKEAGSISIKGNLDGDPGQAWLPRRRPLGFVCHVFISPPRRRRKQKLTDYGENRPCSRQRRRSVLKREGAHLLLSHTHTPIQIFRNALCVVRWHKQSLQCLVCP